MNQTKIESGKVYEVTIGKNTTSVRVIRVDRRVNGQLAFECVNTKTDKSMLIADAARFVKEIKPSKSILQTVGDAVGSILPKGKKTKVETVAETTNDTPKKERAKTVREDGTVSGIEAALIILRESGEPMNIKTIMEKINERGLAKLAGKTPSATISAAMQREISHKADASRFIKAGKGLFAAR